MPSSNPSPIKTSSSSEKGRSLGRVFSLVFLAGFGLLGLAVFFLDLNSFREPIIATINRATGMEVEIESISMDWSGGLGLNAEKLSVRVPETKTRLFSAENLFLKARLEALLEGRFEIEEAVIFKPVLEWTGASRKQAAPSASSTTPAPAAIPERILPRLKKILRRLEIEAQTVRVEKAQISVPFPKDFFISVLPATVSFDLQVNRPGPNHLDIALNNLSFESVITSINGSLVLPDLLGPEAHIELKLAGAGASLAETRKMLAGLSAGPVPAWLDHVPDGAIEGWSFNGLLPLTVVDQPHRAAQMLQGSFAVSASPLDISTPEGVLSVKRFEIRLDGKDGQWGHFLKADLLGGKLNEEGNLALGDDPGAIKGISGAVRWTGLDLAEVPGHRPGWPLQGIFEGEANFSKKDSTVGLGESLFSVNNLVLASLPNLPEVKLGFPRVQGTLNRTGEKLNVDLGGNWLKNPFKLHLKVGLKSNRETFMGDLALFDIGPSLVNSALGKAWNAKQGKGEVSVRIKGVVRDLSRLEAEGMAKGSDWMLDSQKDPEFQIPVKQAEIPFQWKKDTLILSRVRLQPPHGHVFLKGKIQKDTKQYQVDFQALKLRVEDFYKNNLDGQLQFEGNLSGQVLKKGPQSKGVSGTMRIEATNGKFYKLDSLKAILAVINPLSVPQLNQKGLPYKVLDGNFKIQEGLVSTPDLRLLTPEMKIMMEGYADLPNEGINMKGRFQPSQQVDNALRQIPILGDILTGGKKGGLIETRFRLTGPLARPKVTVDAAGSVLGKGADMLKELSRVPGKVAP